MAQKSKENLQRFSDRKFIDMQQIFLYNYPKSLKSKIGVLFDFLEDI